MQILNRLKFSLYGSCSDGLTEKRAPSSAAILGSIAINIISFTTLCAHENSFIHSTKNGGATSAQGLAMSDASLATDRMNSSLILLLFGGEAIMCDHENKLNRKRGIATRENLALHSGGQLDVTY